MLNSGKKIRDNKKRHWLRLPGLGNNNEKLGLPERQSAGIQFRFRNLGTCTLLSSFLRVHPNFWGCNVPCSSSFGGTKKMNCIYSTQGRAPCCFL
jgi:hypothetical protein